MEYKNLDKFKQWIEKNLKMPYGCYDLDACLKEVWMQHCSGGSTNYELSPYETNSGYPECYDYEIEEIYDEEYDCWEITIIF